jgi:hypothetical protein
VSTPSPSELVRPAIGHPETLQPALPFLDEIRKHHSPEFAVIRDDIVGVVGEEPDKIAVFAAMWMALGSLQSPYEQFVEWQERTADTNHSLAIGGLNHQIGYTLVMDDLINEQVEPTGTAWSEGMHSLFTRGVLEARGFGNVRQRRIDALGYCYMLRDALARHWHEGATNFKVDRSVVVFFKDFVESIADKLYNENGHTLQYLREHFLNALDGEPSPGQLILVEFARREDTELTDAITAWGKQTYLS